MFKLVFFLLVIPILIIIGAIAYFIIAAIWQIISYFLVAIIGAIFIVLIVISAYTDIEPGIVFLVFIGSVITLGSIWYFIKKNNKY